MDDPLIETPDDLAVLRLTTWADIVRMLDLRREALGLTRAELAERVEGAGVDPHLITNGLIPRAGSIPPRPSFMAVLVSLEMRDFEDINRWLGAYDRAVRAQRTDGRWIAQAPGSQSVVVEGDNAQVTVHASDTAEPVSTRSPLQEYRFNFLRQALSQANVTFVLSMVFTTAGAVILLVGAVLALVHANSPTSNYLPLITSLAGVLITASGGAFALHAYRARRHAAEQATQVHQDLKCESAFERTSSLIDRVDDTDLRDRLLAIAAVKELGLSPNPIDLTKDLPAKQIETQHDSEGGPRGIVP